ncbi:hypothetical protein CNMCM5793_006042 [Aspergillus hiratsukae]|uniref:Xylanolytic transcriptional activator regulatory domain-containing protein n=1 Tax=Aspergillus hiratsukae TaxID=1194566 RepID=A0A8H6UJQ7_9EURO|nr:hypothetical protein CNMCM5793_006042 [Aspergillus hiratsukae]
MSFHDGPSGPATLTGHGLNGGGGARDDAVVPSDMRSRLSVARSGYTYEDAVDADQVKVVNLLLMDGIAGPSYLAQGETDTLPEITFNSPSPTDDGAESTLTRVSEPISRPDHESRSCPVTYTNGWVDWTHQKTPTPSVVLRRVSATQGQMRPKQSLWAMQNTQIDSLVYICAGPRHRLREPGITTALGCRAARCGRPKREHTATACLQFDRSTINWRKDWTSDLHPVRCTGVMHRAWFGRNPSYPAEPFDTPSSFWSDSRRLIQDKGLWPRALDELGASGTSPNYVESTGPLIYINTTKVEGLPGFNKDMPSQRSGGQISEAIVKCKQLARDIKKQLPSRSPLPTSIHQLLPGRPLLDELVQLYFDTFESCYRILHIELFRAEYESYLSDPETAMTPFKVKLLLVMATAAPLHGDAQAYNELAAKARACIHIAQGWLSAPFEKDRLTLEGIQIHCLLLLARQVNRVGADLAWISAGSLIRMAMQMGLHQDPVYLGNMSMLHRESRRRLWYTILELNVQAALDSGMAPMITAAEYNTQPPSNLDDDDLVEARGEGPPVKAASIPTQTSVQRLLADSLPLRLEATRMINNLQDKPSYDQVLRLGNELASVCRSAAIFADQHASTDHDMSTHEARRFKYNFCEHYLSRFLLSLHYPYAIQSKHNPLYSYSQKVCLEAALDLVSLLEDKTYRRLLLSGGGMYRDIITRGAVVIFLELVTQLEASNSIFSKQRNRARREPLLEAARKVVQYTHDRLWYGETNVRGYLFACMAMAQVEALLDGRPVKEAVINAASQSLAVCRKILESMAVSSLSTSASPPEIASWTYGDMLAMPTVADADFDFLNTDNINFDLSDPCFLQQWTGQCWPQHFNSEEEPRQAPSHGGLDLRETSVMPITTHAENLATDQV